VRVVPIRCFWTDRERVVALIIKLYTIAIIIDLNERATFDSFRSEAI